MKRSEEKNKSSIEKRTKYLTKDKEKIEVNNLDNIEFMVWDEQLRYWEQKSINAKLEEEFWNLKIKKLNK